SPPPSFYTLSLHDALPISYTDDHIGLMDHLGIRQFMVLGFCIGGPFIWNLLQRAGDRVVAAVPAQPSGYRPEMPGLSYNNNMKRSEEHTSELQSPCNLVCR